MKYTDYYLALGLDFESVSLMGAEELRDEIEKAYRAKAHAHHPDKFATEPKEIRDHHAKIFQIVKEAREKLLDGSYRTSHDELLREKSRPFRKARRRNNFEPRVRKENAAFESASDEECEYIYDMLLSVALGEYAFPPRAIRFSEIAVEMGLDLESELHSNNRADRDYLRAALFRVERMELATINGLTFVPLVMLAANLSHSMLCVEESLKFHRQTFQMGNGFEAFLEGERDRIWLATGAYFKKIGFEYLTSISNTGFIE